MSLDHFPKDFIQRYDIHNKSTNVVVYVALKQGINGLPQAGLLAQELLEHRLYQHVYTQSNKTMRFSTHSWRPISFSLVVNDSGVKTSEKSILIVS